MLNMTFHDCFKLSPSAPPSRRRRGRRWTAAAAADADAGAAGAGPHHAIPTKTTRASALPRPRCRCRRAYCSGPRRLSPRGGATVGGAGRGRSGGGGGVVALCQGAQRRGGPGASGRPCARRRAAWSRGRRGRARGSAGEGGRRGTGRGGPLRPWSGGRSLWVYVHGCCVGVGMGMGGRGRIKKGTNAPSAMARVYCPYVMALGFMPRAVSSFMRRTASERWQFVSPPRMQATRRALGEGGNLVGLVSCCARHNSVGRHVPVNGLVRDELPLRLHGRQRAERANDDVLLLLLFWWQQNVRDEGRCPCIEIIVAITPTSGAVRTCRGSDMK